MADTFAHTALNLVSVATALHARGWLLGTSGNLSAVIDRDPVRLAITPSGADKGDLSAGRILLIDEDSKSVGENTGKPSDESPLHIAVVKARSAGAVIHTHSVWATVLSDLHASEGGLTIEGYEMLKGLHGVSTHLHREWIPILENAQDMQTLAQSVNELLAKAPEAHAFLLRRHGVYTWGRDLSEAKRHVEILEFLLEAMGRSTEGR
ncbi:MAG TPA: methylthioribulose 1-phosphate dehydratase [Pyrinomonadaceae bacterium]|jgi:methylthioribulose-1-phosphate dehydratase|nr:methylthioribulose 1-phosphate dehydratase [Pyrinomonadaceae bacterium]